ncbi:uncharacterized protein [Pocillopora verrucosa]|uniref:uncharacterized protein isoform X1 n=1 Tax=Pocillopora verrucosa TaxID=203993 RepID=UPI003341A621
MSISCRPLKSHQRATRPPTHRMSCSSNISGKTLLSKVLSISSPQPKARVLKKPQLEVVVLHANLKLIEEVNIFKDDTAGKQSILANTLRGSLATCTLIEGEPSEFSRASKVNGESAFTNQAIDEQICFGSHVEQFGQLLITLLGHCHGSSKQFKLHEMMNLCVEETPEKRPTASCLRQLLEEVWSTKGDSFV